MWEAKPPSPSIEQGVFVSVKFMHFALVTVEFHSPPCSEQSCNANTSELEKTDVPGHSPAWRKKSVWSKGVAKDDPVKGGPQEHTGRCKC